MYSIVLMAALATGGSSPEFHGYHGYHGCGCGCQTIMYTGCYHSCNCWGWYGNDYCSYCVGHHCYMCYGCHCYGSYITWSCHGCYNGYSCYAAPMHGAVTVLPTGPGPGVLPAPVVQPPVGVQPPVIEPKKGIEIPPTIEPKKGIDIPPAVEPKKTIDIPPTIEPKKDLPKSELKPISTDSTARVVVELPADAKLFVDGRPTNSTSERRLFRTPALQAGQVYFYELRAEVERNGQILSQSQRILLRQGETAQAAFKELQAQPNATAQTADR